MFGVSAWGGLSIPAGARVPVHFDLHGRADGFGSKWVALLPLPLIASMSLLMLHVARRYAPASARALAATAAASTAVQASIHVLLVLAASGRKVDIGLGSLLAQSMLLVVIGNYLPTTRPNGFIGIRLPWTMRSDEVWRRTHALGGRLFVALGVATLLGALVSTLVGHVVLLGGLLVLSVWMGVYSYRLSRRLSGSP